MEVGVAGSGRNAASWYAGDEIADGRNPYNLRRSRTAAIFRATVAGARAAYLDDCAAARCSDPGRVREAIAALGWCRARKRDFGTNVVGCFFPWDCDFAGHDRGHRDLQMGAAEATKSARRSARRADRDAAV